jgi:cytoskeletal protein CcmA (bactofilin family)
MFFNRKSSAPKPTMTYLGSGSEFDGNLKTAGDLRVDGTVRGNVEANGDIEISVEGAIEGAELRGQNILVYGRVKARVVASGKLTLSSTAHLEGDVIAHSLQIDEGAYYLGYISTQDEASPTLLPSDRNLQLPESLPTQSSDRPLS